MFPLAVPVVALLSVAGPNRGPANIVSFQGPSTPNLELALDDLARALGRMTSRTWQRQGTAGRGVRLRLEPASTMAWSSRGPEAFHLVSKGDEVEIVASDPRGLVIGIYDLLDRLGARWPLPGEQFEVLPTRPRIGVWVDVWGEPRFRMREFFGTGGAGSGTPLDKRGDFSRAWTDYMRRNRWGGPDHIRGHTGEAFADAHRAALEAHPDWRAELKGQRVPWSRSLKLCASSTGALEAFQRDRADSLGRQLLVDPTTFAISVEPADGGGHCDCARCRALGGVSDRVFTMANQVARHINATHPGRWVSLLAYNEHAEVPSISLEPNVFVMVVPYGFNRTGLDPDELIAAWKSKVRRLGVYDYWAIPDWAHDVPSIAVGPMLERLDSWAARGIEAFLIESSFSGAATGPALWQASRRFLSAGRPSVDDLHEWVTLVFGTCSQEIEPLFKEWGEVYIPSSAGLGRAYSALGQALDGCGRSSVERSRLLWLARYVEYLRLRFEVDALAKAAPDRAERTRELARWLLAIAPDLSVASYRLVQLLLRSEGADAPLAKELDLARLSRSSLPGISEQESIDRVRTGQRRYAAVDLPKASFRGRWVHPPGSGQATRERSATARIVLLGGMTDLNVRAQTSTSISIALGAYASAPLRVLVYDEAGSLQIERRIEGPGASAELELTADHTYRIKVVDPKNSFRLRVPVGVAVGLTQFVSPAPADALYFWVPPGTRRVVMDVPSLVPSRVLDSNGAVVLDNVRGLVDVLVPESQSGKVWCVSGYKSWAPIRAISVPQAFALGRDDLLVPEEALKVAKSPIRRGSR